MLDCTTLLARHTILGPAVLSIVRYTTPQEEVNQESRAGWLTVKGETPSYQCYALLHQQSATSHQNTIQNKNKVQIAHHLHDADTTRAAEAPKPRNSVTCCCCS
jgi:hypothetical protein